jgi:glycosyltransferase involved in cell wall biosynthesis
MATYNAMPHLQEAVNSIMAQTLSEFRLIIVDDASSDGTGAYLATLVDCRVGILQLILNSGQGVARNLALKHCDTKYVAIMDGDDISEPERLAAQVDFLEANPSVGAVGTQFSYLGTQGRTGFGAPLPCEHEGIYDNLLNGRHAMVNGSACFRTSVLKACGGYGISRSGEDWDIFLRIGESSKLANLDRRYYLYRVRRQSTSATHLAEMRLNYSLAADNARRRAAGLEEISLDYHMNALRRRPLMVRVLSKLELSALALYRAGVGDVLHGHALAGYSQVAAAAVMSPAWSMRRLARIIRGREIDRRERFNEGP